MMVGGDRQVVDEQLHRPGGEAATPVGGKDLVPDVDCARIEPGTLLAEVVVDPPDHLAVDDDAGRRLGGVDPRPEKATRLLVASPDEDGHVGRGRWAQHDDAVGERVRQVHRRKSRRRAAIPTDCTAMTVYLVGAGPGDPGLLTVRGAEVLGRADVVVYDRLSIAALLDLAPATAERISVGKTPRGPSTPQEEINRLLVEHGRAGREVVRLKGGDVFVFARGGEEAAALAEAGIDFEVVPGITSAIAVPAYAGVPVTHRGLSTSFTVVTGHEDPWAATETDWEAVARVGGTIVVLMGAATRGEIAARLMAAGLPGDTPVAAIRWGTRPEQVTIRTTLGSLGASPVESPSTIVIGAVAGLDLAWFERRPLFGRTIVVTRSREQASTLRVALERFGATVIEAPVLEIEPRIGRPRVGTPRRRVAGRHLGQRR